MLSKLFKHEMKATARLLLPLYLILAVLTIMDRIVIYLDIFKGVLAVIPGFITFAYVASIIAILIVSSVIVIYRFYKNLMTDEGYLMFTLPVSPHHLINSKLLVSIIWNIGSLVGVILSLLIVFSGSSAFADFPEAWRQLVAAFKAEFGSYSAIFVVEIILLIICSIINSILTIYVSIAIGQFFNGHKILGSIAAYIGISAALQIFTTAASIIFGFIFRNSVDDITLLPMIVFPMLLLFLIVLNAIYYVVTNYIFKRRLNLE